MQEVVGSNPAGPTIYLEEPFGQLVEGLSHCGDKTYADELPVQTEDFEDSAFGGMIRRKPFLPQVLPKFKRFEGDGLVPAPVARLDLQAQSSSFVSQFLGLGMAQCSTSGEGT
ncbi:MAG: hypothetical protein U0792_20065 [Gemmataceae bacterium]